MKLFFMMIKNLKMIIPYLTLIAIYFFFINLEARKKEVKNAEKENILLNDKSSIVDKKIKIPVIPFNE